MIFPGLPITIEFSGTLKLTKAPGAISTSLPMVMFPITIEFAKMQQLFPILGVPHVPFILQLKRPEQYYNCAQLQNWDEQLLIQNVVSEIHVLSLFLPEFEPQICILNF